MQITYFSLFKWSFFGLQCLLASVTADEETNTGIFIDNIVSWDRHEQAVLAVTRNAENGTAQLEQTIRHVYVASIQTELSRRLSSEATILLSGDDGFEAINTRYTQYRRPTYIAAVKVKHEQDIVETINYARARSISFSIRNGGHALTTSLRSIQDGIVIDVSGLDSIVYDKARQRMTVGAGVSTGQFTNATHSKGMEVTVGSCPCTGVLGISLGAGIGRLQGKYGYLNDNMVSIRLLLANGTIVTASEDENPDLFWAVRGAGHNFGVGLEATFQVYPQKYKGKHYVVDYEFDLEKAEDVFEALNSVSSPMSEKIAFFVIGRARGQKGNPTININFVYAGPKSEAQSYEELFESISPIWTDKKVVAWDALPWATYNGLNNILCTPEGWARFPIKNFYGANVKTYDISTMRSFVDEWRDMNAKHKGEAMFSFMFESFAQQSVRERPEDTTAYPWRHGSDHFLMIEAAYKSPSHEADFDEWLSAQQHAFIKTSGYGRLQQYVNYGHGSKDPVEALYGYEPWRLEKLRKLKAEFDPEGHFSGYQPF